MVMRVTNELNLHQPTPPQKKNNQNDGSVRCLIAWNVLRTHSISYQNPLSFGMILNCPDRNIIYKSWFPSNFYIKIRLHNQQKPFSWNCLFLRKEKEDILISPTEKHIPKIFSPWLQQIGELNPWLQQIGDFFHPSLQLPPFPSFHPSFFALVGWKMHTSPVNHGLPRFPDRFFRFGSS